MHKLFIQTFALFLTAALGAIEQKIIYLVSPPRSLSVAFLRMMDQRGDFAIIHEPGLAAFNRIHHPMWAKTVYKADAPQSFQEVQDLIFHTAEKRPVFVKEMGFAAQEYLPQMPDFLNKSEAYFVFLIRNPHHSLISHYRKYSHLHDVLDKILSYKELYYLYVDIQNKIKNPPLILLTEELYERPKETIQSFCRAVGIPFKEESLYWDDLGDQFSGEEEWKETKYQEMTQHWHKEAIRSTGFGKPSTYAVDKENQPTFEEIENLEHREAYKQIYKENMPYYRLLLEAAKKQ